MAWIGHLGSLTSFKGAAAQELTWELEAEIDTTLGGTDYAWVEAGLPPRSWSVNLDACEPDEAAVLGALAAGANGRGPYLFVDDAAAVSNVLSPRASMPGSGNSFAYSTTTGTPSEAIIAGIGKVAAVTADGGARVDLAYKTPVVAEQPVTASAYMRGSGTGSIEVAFLDATGAALSQPKTTFTTPTGWTRMHVTGTPPVGAVSCQITVTSTSGFAVAAPAVSWTGKLTSYTAGQGAPAVMFTGMSTTVLAATTEQQMTQRSLQFRELRSANA